MSRASRASAKQVRAAKRLAGRVQDGWQVTLDQLAAADALDSEEDRAAVLSAGESWRWKEQSIRARMDREQKAARKLESLVDAGIPVQADGDAPEGIEHVANVFWCRAAGPGQGGREGAGRELPRDHAGRKHPVPGAQGVTPRSKPRRTPVPPRPRASTPPPNRFGMRLFRFVLADAFACGVELEERVGGAVERAPDPTLPFELRARRARAPDWLVQGQPARRALRGRAAPDVARGAPLLRLHAPVVGRAVADQEPASSPRSRRSGSAGFGAFDEGDAWLEERAREAAGETGERG